MKWKRLVLGLTFLLGIGALLTYLSLEGLLPGIADVRSQRLEIEAFLMAEPFLGALIFVLLYALAVALFFPVASLLTLLGGFLFGSVLGTILVALGATAGATASFLLARFFFRDFFRERLGTRLARLDEELRGHGLRDLFLVRLIPLFPFWLINVGAALTGVRLRDYVLATFFGILPFTFVYANAGTSLAEIEELSDIVSLPVLLAVSLIVLATLVGTHLRKWRVRSGERVDTPPGA